LGFKLFGCSITTAERVSVSERPEDRARPILKAVFHQAAVKIVLTAIGQNTKSVSDDVVMDIFPARLSLDARAFWKSSSCPIEYELQRAQPELDQARRLRRNCHTQRLMPSATMAVIATTWNYRRVYHARLSVYSPERLLLGNSAETPNGP
jgi:hypothetical protein